MMNCKKCNSEINMDTKFCGVCGDEVVSSFTQEHNEENNEKNHENYNSNQHNKKSMDKIFKIIGAVIGLVLAIVMLGGESKDVSLVKEGSFNSYPDVPIGDAFESFFTDSSWESFESKEGDTIVEFTGVCTYMEQEVDATIQFVLYEDKTFEMTYFDMNGIPQNGFMNSALIEKVVESYYQ